jgi:hypothetical protein
VPGLVVKWNLQINIVSINIAASDEYPRMPCNVNGDFVEPMIMKMVAVISRIIPIDKNLSTKEVTSFLRCSVIIERLYESNANITMLAPIMEYVFISWGFGD